MNKYLLAVGLTLLFSTSIYAQTDDAAEVIEEVKFQPHMIEHLNKGCPENSSCTKEVGEISEKFKAAFKTNKTSQFVKSYGVPFSFWTTRPKEKNTIIYQSRCNNHRPQKDKFGKTVIDRPNIYEGIRFIKNTQDLLADKDILPNVMLRDKSNKLEIIPRAALPAFTSGNQSFFRQSYRDNDFQLVISNGKLDLTQRKFPDVEIKNVQCSKELIEKFKSLSSTQLYQSAYCKSIYDTKSKKYQRFIFGWSC